MTARMSCPVERRSGDGVRRLDGRCRTAARDRTAGGPAARSRVAEQAGEDGGPTQWQTRSGAFRGTGGGNWVPAEVPLSAGQRTVEAAARLPAHGAVTGWAAL